VDERSVLVCEPAGKKKAGSPFSIHEL